MSKLRVSRDATADLDEVWLHIANRGGVEAAQRYINHLTAKKIGIRSHTVDDYVVYNRHKKGLLTILHVVHGVRDVMALFR